MRDAFVLQRSQTKGARTRTVYINRTLRVALEQYRPTLYSVEPTAPLFESRKGGHFSANTMCQLFLTVFADCGLRGATSHTPRRTFITQLANKGVGMRRGVCEVAPRSPQSENTARNNSIINCESLADLFF